MTSTVTPIKTFIVTVTSMMGAPPVSVVADHTEKPENNKRCYFTLPRWTLLGSYLNLLPNLMKGRSMMNPSVRQNLGSIQNSYVETMSWTDLVDALYNVYCKSKTAKKIWKSLDRKYNTEDVGTKKFVMARFLDYKTCIIC